MKLVHSEPLATVAPVFAGETAAAEAFARRA